MAMTADYRSKFAALHRYDFYISIWVIYTQVGRKTPNKQTNFIFIFNSDLNFNQYTKHQDFLAELYEKKNMQRNLLEMCFPSVGKYSIDLVFL